MSLNVKTEPGSPPAIVASLSHRVIVSDPTFDFDFTPLASEATA